MEQTNLEDLPQDQLLQYIKSHLLDSNPDEIDFIKEDGLIYINVYLSHKILSFYNQNHVVRDSTLYALFKRDPSKPGHVRRVNISPRVYYYCLVDLLRVRFRDRPGLPPGTTYTDEQRSHISDGQKKRHKERPIRGTYKLSPAGIANIQDGRRAARERRTSVAQ